MVEIMMKTARRRRGAFVCSVSLCFTFGVTVILASMNLLEGWLTATDSVLLLSQLDSLVVAPDTSGNHDNEEPQETRTVDPTPDSWTTLSQRTPEKDSIGGSDTKPRIAALGYDDWAQLTNNDMSSGRKVKRLTPHSSNTTKSSYLLAFEKPFYNDCELQSNWTARPTCNLVHEFDITAFIHPISFHGSWRSVWDYEPDVAVFKQLHIHRDFNTESYDRHTLDAIVMERLTASPHVSNLFAFCGPSVIAESATGSARLMVKDKNWTTYERLHMARNITQGLADIHAAQVLHRDINMANVLNIRNHLKFNDFNIGILERVSNTNGTVCPIPVRFPAPLWRAPEEIANATYVNGPAADIYGLGNLLFQILTRHQPWTHLEPNGKLHPDVVAEYKLQGRLPHLPLKYSNASAASQILTHAVRACWKNATERPTAARLVKVMDHALRFIAAQPNVSIGLPSSDGATLFDVERE